MNSVILNLLSFCLFKEGDEENDSTKKKKYDYEDPKNIKKDLQVMHKMIVTPFMKVDVPNNLVYLSFKSSDSKFSKLLNEINNYFCRLSSKDIEAASKANKPIIKTFSDVINKREDEKLSKHILDTLKKSEIYLNFQSTTSIDNHQEKDFNINEKTLNFTSSGKVISFKLDSEKIHSYLSKDYEELKDFYYKKLNEELENKYTNGGFSIFSILVKKIYYKAERFAGDRLGDYNEVKKVLEEIIVKDSLKEEEIKYEGNIKLNEKIDYQKATTLEASKVMSEGGSEKILLRIPFKYLGDKEKFDYTKMPPLFSGKNNTMVKAVMVKNSADSGELKLVFHSIYARTFKNRFLNAFGRKSIFRREWMVSMVMGSIFFFGIFISNSLRI